MILCEKPIILSNLLHVSRLIFRLSINRCFGTLVFRSAVLPDSHITVEPGPHQSVCCTRLGDNGCAVRFACPPFLPIHSLFCLPPVRCECRVATGGDGEPGSRSYPAAQQHQRRCTAMVQVPPPLSVLSCCSLCGSLWFYVDSCCEIDSTCG